jgi:hypothetical protein
MIDRDLDQIVRRIEGAFADEDMCSAGYNARVRYRDELRRMAARRFAELFGLTVVKTPFGPRALAHRKVQAKRDWFPSGAVKDHAYYYRHERRAAAVVVHLYGVNRPHILDFARREHLSASWAPGVPSWWYPGRTELVVYTPRGGELPGTVPLADDRTTEAVERALRRVVGR